MAGNRATRSPVFQPAGGQIRAGGGRAERSGCMEPGSRADSVGDPAAVVGHLVVPAGVAALGHAGDLRADSMEDDAAGDGASPAGIGRGGANAPTAGRTKAYRAAERGDRAAARASTPGERLERRVSGKHEP